MDKYAIQLRAEEIAEQSYGCDFYDLCDEMQCQVYNAATLHYADSLADRAEYLREAKVDAKGGE